MPHFGRRAALDLSSLLHGELRKCGGGKQSSVMYIPFLIRDPATVLYTKASLDLTGDVIRMYDSKYPK